MRKHEYIGSCSDINARFCIKGIDLFKYKWSTVGDVVVVIDPNTKMPRNFSAYKITVGEREINFVAGKLSNGKWGFYEYEK